MEDKKKVDSNLPGSDHSRFDQETKRLRRDIFRSDEEKFNLFIRMLRTNALFKKAIVTHK
ncbi:hypothetical protein EDD80_10683 [Anseongella ginsenosidimutans]|uniref:Uncharacterized protein n=1 Tax=Anseongella ginsenosidimutans TaxID=496056 RepID=A0A4R3KQZ1_9SPHI|nr:hypothetical protein [Anseongella ginsenosidimutans]QEC52223.1 hypothetical protein FRZ59_07665 [Anseongella ginsenosidimutans]TCS86773.1 hypothetical protein EDD80_10683 [Anseongella ginsenosidimutans]